MGDNMKVRNLPVDMIAYHTAKGEPTPIKFQVIDGHEVCTIKVNKVLDRVKEKALGKNILRFSCVSIINGIEKRYELRLFQETVQWVLYKM